MSSIGVYLITFPKVPVFPSKVTRPMSCELEHTHAAAAQEKDAVWWSDR